MPRRPERDSETLLAETLREGERIEGEWRVSPWLHLWAVWRSSSGSPLVTLVGVILASATLPSLLEDPGFTLPSVNDLSCVQVVMPLVLLLMGVLLVRTWIDELDARCVLTDARFLYLHSGLGRWAGVQQVELSRCRWLYRRGTVSLWSYGARGEVAEHLEVPGLRHGAELVTTLQRLAGPPAAFDERRAFVRQLRQRGAPEAALVSVFQRPVGPSWSKTGLGPWRCVAEGVWFELDTPRPPPRPPDSPFVTVSYSHDYQILGALTLAGMPYTLHGGGVYVPHAPLPLEPAWTEGEADTPVLLAEAIASLADPGDFDPSRWHRLDRASRSLLRALDQAGALRAREPS